MIRGGWELEAEALVKIRISPSNLDIADAPVPINVAYGC
jgi:hypothetical protein